MNGAPSLAERFPAVFDPAVYRAVNSDLTQLDDAALRMHYFGPGTAEGRRANALATREAFRDVAAGAERILELITPGERIFQRPDVTRFCRCDPAAAANAHYASANGDLSAIGAEFDVIANSHLLVREPDLANHLQQIERLLAEGGVYLLFIPDKRYTFDHFLPESSIADVVEAALNRPAMHTARTLIGQQCMTTHNDSWRHWAGDHGKPAHLDADSVSTAIELAAAGIERGEYIDRNAWQFTPKSFETTISLLHGLGLTRLRPARVYPTLAGSNEFWAVLSR